jgi:hypothetical protein
MTLKSQTEFWVLGIWLAAAMIFPRACEAITLNQPGYIATQIGTISPDIPDDLELDSAGNLFFACGAGGVRRVTPAGSVSTWSTAPASDLTLTPGGDGYGAGRGLCDCILRIEASGAYSTFYEDVHEWTYTALISDGTLYATIWAGAGKGLYQINRSSGQPMLLAAGGPSVAGHGPYYGMTQGSDGKLYVLGSLDATQAGNRLFRLDGSELIAVATPPHGGQRLALGPSGKFFVVTAFDYGSGVPTGEVWIVDPVSGESSLFVTSGSFPGVQHPLFKAAGYDPGTETLYVAEEWNVWAIKKDPTPAQPDTWGAVKARYRGTRPAGM